jgi:hypothetical protein
MTIRRRLGRVRDQINIWILCEGFKERFGRLTDRDRRDVAKTYFKLGL